MAQTVVDDERIKRDVERQLQWDNSFDSSQVKVEVSEGVVRLMGTVRALSAKRAAELDARAIEGVVTVSNELKVECPPTHRRPDDQIRAMIEDLFRWSADINAADINVDVEDGWVTLSGSVDAYWKRIKAEDMVSDLLGVVGVVNNLNIVPSRSGSDKAIAEDIRSALSRIMTADRGNVRVEVERGVVTLRGTIATWDMHEAVFDIACYTAGVVNVINQLKVE